MFLLLVYVGGALASSFFCSVLEAGLLSIRIGELQGRAAKGERGASLLLEYKEGKIDDAIAAILTLNTVAHTVGATLAGAQAAKTFGSEWVGVFSAILTLLVLVVTEIIPKTLGTVYASQLVGFIGRSIWLLTRILSPILIVTGFLTKLIARDEENTISRGELQAMVHIASRQGTLAKGESKVLSNVLGFEAVHVADIMTPRTVVAMAQAGMSLSDFAADVVIEPYSRVPVYESDQDDITGYALQREVLSNLARGVEPTTPIRACVRPVKVVVASQDIKSLLSELLRDREHIAIVVDEFGSTRGVVTLEDVVETILGEEILDEVDRVGDLRKLAIQKRDERLERRRRESQIPDDKAQTPSSGDDGAEVAGSDE